VKAHKPIVKKLLIWAYGNFCQRIVDRLTSGLGSLELATKNGRTVREETAARNVPNCPTLEIFILHQYYSPEPARPYPGSGFTISV
jgi:hypothetical protein